MEDQLAGESQKQIDAWPHNAGQSLPAGSAALNFVHCVPTNRNDEKAAADGYARLLAELMQARLFNLQAPTCVQQASVLLEALSDNCDLFMTAGSPPLDLIRGTSDDRLPSLLISRHVAWPIHRILLLMRGQATDRATVEWGLRLAQRANSQVTLLVVLPPQSRQGDRYDSQLADILARDTVPGRYVRQVLNRLVTLDVEAVLRLRQGTLTQQVRYEVARGEFDLIVTSAEPPGRLLSGHLENLIVPLLQWTSAPLLVARFPALWLEEESEGKNTI